MNTTVKYILIGSAAALGGYIIIRKLAPPPAEKPTLGSGVGGIIDGVKTIFDVFKGNGSKAAGAPSSSGSTGVGTYQAPVTGPLNTGGGGRGDLRTPIGARLGDSPYARVAVYASDGGAAMPDALGQDRVERQVRQPEEMRQATRAQRAATGVVNYSHYGLRPARARA